MKKGNEETVALYRFVLRINREFPGVLKGVLGKLEPLLEEESSQDRALLINGALVAAYQASPKPTGKQLRYATYIRSLVALSQKYPLSERIAYCIQQELKTFSEKKSFSEQKALEYGFRISDLETHRKMQVFLNEPEKPLLEEIKGFLQEAVGLSEEEFTCFNCYFWKEYNPKVIAALWGWSQPQQAVKVIEKAIRKMIRYFSGHDLPPQFATA